MDAHLLLAALPVATFATSWYAMRPSRSGGHSGHEPPVPAAERLAIVRAAIAVGAYAVVTVELLSAVRWLNQTGIVLVWVFGLVVATGAAALRRLNDPAPVDWRRLRLGPAEWLMVAMLVTLMAGTLTIALASPPNNWDSQSYHLPKVEEWAQAASVGFFPTSFPPQVALPPGAEYLLLHLRLLTGADRLYNLIQWQAWLVCALGGSRIAAQLGARRFGQVFVAVLFAAAPAVILEATSTQTDLVTSAWCVCAATVALDAAKRRLRVLDVALLGVAAGLAVLAKPTGLVTVGVLLAFWFIARTVRLRSIRAAAGLAGAAVAIAAVGLVVSGPFLVRMTVEYGNPLGPPEETVTSVSTHSPAALAVNAARLLQTSAMMPENWINDDEVKLVRKVAHKLGVDVNDPDISRGTYPLATTWWGPDEDLASYPLQDVAIAVGVLGCLIFWRRDRMVVGYVLACLLVGVGFSATVRWQAFGNRLLLPGLAVSLPLAGLVADGLVRAARARAYRFGMSAALTAVAGLAFWGGGDAILNGQPRALIGPNSVLTADSMDLRFERVPDLQADYEWAAQQIVASGAQRVGLIEDQVWNFEYPLWVMLRGSHIELLQSTVPGHPAASPDTFDAIICFDQQPPDCHGLVPTDWQVQSHPFAVLAIRPGLSNHDASSAMGTK